MICASKPLANLQLMPSGMMGGVMGLQRSFGCGPIRIAGTFKRSDGGLPTILPVVVEAFLFARKN